MLRVTGLCEGYSPVTGEFPSQRASNAEQVSICWRHYDSTDIFIVLTVLWNDLTLVLVQMPEYVIRKNSKSCRVE